MISDELQAKIHVTIQSEVHMGHVKKVVELSVADSACFGEGY